MIHLPELPRIALAHLPTPLEAMDRLRKAMDARPRLFVKRDDCTGLAFGGNKTRKLEFAMADAAAKGAKVIITSGGAQSNHVRQTAAAAAKLGLVFHAVLSDPFLGTNYRPQARYHQTGNPLLDRLLGGMLYHASDDGGATDALISELTKNAQAAGVTPYVVPLGVSDGIGGFGYAHMAAELLAQCKAQGVSPSHIVLATGSAGTHGGLLVGLRACGADIDVIGVSVSEPAEAKRIKVRNIIDQMAGIWGATAPAVSDRDIVVTDAYVGAGYAIPSAEGQAAINYLARTEGLLLDPVYTGKAMAGFLDLVQNGPLAEGRDVVFVHTGGAPALFAYPETMTASGGGE